MDPCLMYFKLDGELKGLLALHVDDMIVSGAGPGFQRALAMLREKLPFRKWKTREGEFCGSQLKQLVDGTIEVSQEEFPAKMKMVKISIIKQS